MVYKTHSDYKYMKLHSESEEIFSGVQFQHETSYLNIRDLIMTKGKRKKRTWIIAAVVSAVVIGLIIAAIIILTNSEKNGDTPKPDLPPALALEDILSGKVNPNSFNATWVSGNEILYVNENGDLVLHNLATRSPKTVLLPANHKSLIGAVGFELSADKKYLKVGHSYQKRYRYSYKAKYTIVDLATKEANPLEINEKTDFLLAVWSPTGNAIVVVIENNIFYKPSVELPLTIQITNSTNNEINGVPDWVYEEEVFSSNKALWFSPNGKKLAYARFDDKLTQVMVLPIYGEPLNPIFQYPRAQFFRYPKAGTPNPTVSLHFVDLDTNVSDELEVPTRLAPLEPILSTVAWATDDDLTAIWMNRVQNKASIVSYSTTETPAKQIIVKDLSEEKGWLDLFTPPIFAEDGSKFSLILSQNQGGNLGSYRHAVLLSLKENSEIEALTRGAFVVTQLLGYNEDRNELYYTANTANDSAVQHVYSVSLQGSRGIKCLTCDLTAKDNKTNCLYNIAELSQDASNYVLTCAGPAVPNIALYSIDGRKIMDWEDNDRLRSLTESKVMPETRRFSFEVDGGFTAQVMLKLPPNLDTSGNTKYPMLVNVYAGPDSFQVVEKFNLDWGSYLAVNKSIIYATIDGRGSGLKGDEILFSSYRQLGTVEIIDQINVTKQIQERLPYVDARRTAIWGWSYGGYASGMVLANDKEDIFKCGISVAPVTDWRLYDSIYTERFMGLPAPNDNEKGYLNANLLLKFNQLRDKEYFLIHGTYDDNVHYQQSMLWAKALELNDILFRQLSYPDEDHGLASVRPHLYHSLENFLDECFIKEGN